jgi:hypothetical protein
MPCPVLLALFELALLCTLPHRSHRSARCRPVASAPRRRHGCAARRWQRCDSGRGRHGGGGGWVGGRNSAAHQAHLMRAPIRPDVRAEPIGTGTRARRTRPRAPSASALQTPACLADLAGGLAVLGVRLARAVVLRNHDGYQRRRIDPHLAMVDEGERGAVGWDAGRLRLLTRAMEHAAFRPNPRSRSRAD